ncbi:hypothetical protein ACFY3N_35470 [Streptomyces sp. NPDC000348]|uniref:hypothetical protein n=1 Tax=Streptomyces sp. NPDC000348 TaxID=3364538 RepID=UPI00369481E5
MNNLMIDCRVLVRLDSAELSQELRSSAPPKFLGQWIFALLDIACTDCYPVNQEPGINLTVRLQFASELLKFVEQELDAIDPLIVTRAYIKIARKGVEGNAGIIPPSLKVDAVRVRTLQCFRLTPAEALEVAGAQRSCYQGALAAGLEGGEFDHAVRVEGYSDLQPMLVLLPEARWFQKRSAPQVSQES